MPSIASKYHRADELTGPGIELHSDDLDQLLRLQIQRKVQQHFSLVHHRRRERAFIPGSTPISVAGRFYQSEEMETLVESGLDFWLTAGRFAEQFERDFARMLGVRSAALVNSGSSANLIAFMALTSPSLGDRRIVRGDEVITVAAGFPTTVSPALQYGAVPVFLDVTVDDGTYNIDTAQLESALSPRTKAVMIAHTLGNPFNLDVVKSFCDKHGLWLIEDNCDALGSRYRGQLTGTFGHLATSSFYPAHHLTTGEGGAVYTNDPKLRKIVESFRDWGRDCWCASGRDNTCGKRFGWTLGELPAGYDHKYIYSHFGYNLKVSDMQAAVGCVQLRRLDDFILARRQNWEFLRAHLARELEPYFVLPQPTPQTEPSWFGFLLTRRSDAPFSRGSLISFLEQRKIQTRMLFAGNLVRQPCFDPLRSQPGSFRVVGDLRETDRILANTFWIGVHPGLTPPMKDYMVASLLEFIRSPQHWKDAC